MHVVNQNTMKSNLIVVLIFSLFCFEAQSQKSILAIFVHPDDETNEQELILQAIKN